MVESREVDLHAEHPPHKREQPRVFTPVAFDDDGDSLRSWLPGAYNHGPSRVTEHPEVFSIWRQHIYPVRRQSTQGINGEVEPVGRVNSDGVAVLDVSIRRPGGQCAVNTAGAASVASLHNPATQ